MCNLQIVVRRLVEEGISGELWVGNSFVTEKIDPADIDLFLWINSDFFDKATPKQREVMQWFHDNLKEELGCDSKLWINYEPTHPDHAETEWWRASCLTIFGFYHPQGPNVYETKGIALLKLPDCIA